eukprot:6505501-Pyramimonas_sp.AAC.2
MGCVERIGQARVGMGWSWRDRVERNKGRLTGAGSGARLAGAPSATQRRAAGPASIASIHCSQVSDGG